MDYVCSVCGQKVAADLMVFKLHTEKHIIDLVKHDHPNWIDSEGLCKKCFDYYKQEINGTTFKDAACAVRQRNLQTFFSGITNLFKRKKV